MSEVCKKHMESLFDHLDAFLSYLKIERHRSPKTIIAYRNEINYLLNTAVFLFKKNEESPQLLINNGIIKLSYINTNEEFGLAHIRHLINNFCGERCQNNENTISRKISSLRAFFSYLEENEQIIKNPIKKMRPPAIKPKIPYIPEIEEFEAVVNYYQIQIDKENERFNKIISKQRESLSQKNHLKHAKRLRNLLNNHLLLRFLYSSMVRCSELIGLQVKNLYCSMNAIKVLGKGGKERFIEIDPVTSQMLADMIRDEKLGPDDHVFRNRHNRPYHYPNALEARIRRIRKALNLQYKLSPHFFRKAGSSHSLWNGASIASMQDTLGHSSPNTTRIYAQTSPKYLSQQREYHPLSIKKSSP